MKGVKEFYNVTATAWSEEYFEEKRRHPVTKKFYECFSKGGTPHPKILDLGCGAGYDSKVLSELGAKVVGVDISENLIDIAKQNVKGCKFFVGDITDKLTNLGRFDGIMCLATIIHIGIDKIRDSLQNMANALKRGGLLIVSVVDGVGKNIEKSFVKIDDEIYDRDLNKYNASNLCAFAYPTLKLVDTWKFEDFEDGWRYYIFMKE